MIIPLLKLDSKKAIAMLTAKNKINSDIVVQQLEQQQYFLYLVYKLKRKKQMPRDIPNNQNFSI